MSSVIINYACLSVNTMRMTCTSKTVIFDLNLHQASTVEKGSRKCLQFRRLIVLVPTKSGVWIAILEIKKLQIEVAVDILKCLNFFIISPLIKLTITLPYS